MVDPLSLFVVSRLSVSLEPELGRSSPHVRLRSLELGDDPAVPAHNPKVENTAAQLSFSLPHPMGTGFSVVGGRDGALLLEIGHTEIDGLIQIQPVAGAGVVRPSPAVFPHG